MVQRSIGSADFFMYTHEKEGYAFKFAKDE